MENRTTFGRFEASVIIINLICSKVFLNFPRMLIEVSGTAAWIQLIYASILSFILITAILQLFKKFEGMDLIDIMDYLGLNLLTKLIGLVFVVYLTFTISIIIREYGENMKTVSLESSPISFVLMFFIGGAVIAVYKGLEIIARAHAIAVPIIAIVFLNIMILAYPNYDVNNFFPIMGNGFKKIFIKGFLGISIYSPMIYLYILPPYLKTNKNFKSSIYGGFLISFVFLLITVLGITMSFPYPVGKENLLPFYSLTRLINYGRFFERIESVFIIIWTLAGLMYMSAAFFMIEHFLQKSFKLKYYQPIIIPIAVIITVTCLLPRSIYEVIKFDERFYAAFSWIITFIIPGFILVGANIKRFLKDRVEMNNDKKRS